MSEIKNRDDLITEFGENLWFATVEKIVVNADDRVVFTFKNGAKTTIEV